MRASNLLLRVGVLFLAITSWASGQNAGSPSSMSKTSPTANSTPSISTNDTLLQTFQNEQDVLIRERQALIAQGATQAQIQTWRQKNVNRFTAQQQRAEALANESPSMTFQIPRPTPIPSDASPQLAAYLKAQNQLIQSKRQVWNQFATSDHAARQTAMQQWRQQNALLIRQVRQDAQALAQANSANQN